MDESPASGRNGSSLWSIMGHKVWETLSTAARLVYTALDYFFKNKNICWPSYATLKKKTGIKTDATIGKALDELEERGLIVRKSKGKGRSNLYEKSTAYLKSSSINEEVSSSKRRKSSSFSEEVAPQKMNDISSMSEAGPLQPVKGNNILKNDMKENNEQREVVVSLVALGMEERKAEEVVKQKGWKWVRDRVQYTKAHKPQKPLAYLQSIMDKEIDPPREETVGRDREEQYRKQRESLEEGARIKEEAEREERELDEAYEALGAAEKGEVERMAEEIGKSHAVPISEKQRRRMAMEDFLKTGKGQGERNYPLPLKEDAEN